MNKNNTGKTDSGKNPNLKGNAEDLKIPETTKTGDADLTVDNSATDASPASGYTSLNEQTWGEGGTGLAGYNELVKAQKQSGGAATAYNGEAFRQQLIAAGIDPALANVYSQNGGYTQDRDTAIAGGGTGDPAQGFYQDGTWYSYPGVNREVKAGTSGADEAHLSDASYAYIQYCQAMYENATTPEDKAYWHNEAEKTRARAGYSGGADGSMYIPIAQLEIEQAIQDVLGQSSNNAGAAANTPEAKMQALLDAWKEAALEQSNGQIDYAVAQAIKELERALEDAQPQFKEQAESVSLEAQQAMDNAALYAELRGDKGGIGQEQYSSIQNTAAQNHLAVQQAQTKLSTDTARQIEDLRAQGEFEKADKALEITQNYLAQLIGLEQWAAEYGMTQQQFQASLNQWEAEYNMALQQIGIAQNQWQQEFDFAKDKFDYDKIITDAQLQLQQDQFAFDKYVTGQQLQLQQDKYKYELGQAAASKTEEMGWMWFNAGQIENITDEQLQAMGFRSREEAKSMYDAMVAAGKETEPDANSYYNMLYAAGYTPEDKASILALLTSKGLSTEEAELIYNAYADREYISTQLPTDGWGAGMPDSEWESFFGVLKQPIAGGNVAYVQQMLEQYGDKISRDQWMQLQTFMEKVGFDPSGLSWLD